MHSITSDEQGDFYMARNPVLIKKLLEAHEQHIKGEVIPFAEMKKQYHAPPRSLP